MKFDLKVMVEDDFGKKFEFDIARIDRKNLTLESLGLTLAEGKTILGQIQQIMATAQSSHYVEEQRRCNECQKTPALKGHHDLVIRTVFGKLRLDSPGLYACKCRYGEEKSYSPLAMAFY